MKSKKTNQINKNDKGDGPCFYCNSKNNPIWSVDNSLWNAVTMEHRGKILCLYCFIKKAHSKYDILSWKVTTCLDMGKHAKLKQ